MAFGISLSGGGGDFLPILKYDARAGRFFREDKNGGGEADKVDVTRNLKMVVDFENLEIGWMLFARGSAPDYAMVPFGDKVPPAPSENHKQGVRFCVKLNAEAGGDVRELSSSARSFLNGMDPIHTAYVQNAAANPGKLPVVALKDTIPVESGKGANKSTNYQPVFELIAWVDRPKDLVANPRNKTAASAPAAPVAAPPATGSTVVPPPAPKPAPAMAAADDLDFG